MDRLRKALRKNSGNGISESESRTHEKQWSPPSLRRKNEVCRSTSFRFEKYEMECPSENSASSVISLAADYNTPKDLVNLEILDESLYSQNLKDVLQNLRSDSQKLLLEVEYSDPRDSKLYSTPGIDPETENFYKLYVQEASVYCKPVENLDDFYESYHSQSSSNCITVINVSPSSDVSKSFKVNSIRSNHKTSCVCSSSSLTTHISIPAIPQIALCSVQGRQGIETSPKTPPIFECRKNPVNFKSHQSHEILGFSRKLGLSTRSSIPEIPICYQKSENDSEGKFFKFGYSKNEVWNWLYNDDDEDDEIDDIDDDEKKNKKNNLVLSSCSLQTSFLSSKERHVSISAPGCSSCLFSGQSYCSSAHSSMSSFKSGKLTNEDEEENRRKETKCEDTTLFKALYTTLDTESSVYDVPVKSTTIDPSLPLERQDWFHGSISRNEAESVLQLHRCGSFLVRNSESSSSDFSLSLKTTSGLLLHLKISLNSHSEFVLGLFSSPFPSIPKMILHFVNHPLPLKGGTHFYLQFPIREQLL